MKTKKRFKDYFILISFLICSAIVTLNSVTIEANDQDASQNNLKVSQVETLLSNSLYATDSDMYLNEFIEAELLTPTFTNVNVGDEITVKYNVQIPDLYEIEPKKYDEVVILVDISKYMYGEKWKGVKEFFVNYFDSALVSKDLKLGIIPYIQSPFDTQCDHQHSVNSLMDLSDEKNVMLIAEVFEQGCIIPKEYDGHVAIDWSLKKATELLETGFQQEKNQAIIIVSSGSTVIDDQNNIVNFNKYEHDVFTIEINDSSKPALSVSAADLHAMIQGKDSNFISVNSNPVNVIDALSSVIRNVTTAPNQNRQMLNSNLGTELNELDELVLAIDVSSHMFDEKWTAIREFFSEYFRYSSKINDLSLGIVPIFDGRNIDPENRFDKLLYLSNENLNGKENINKIQRAFSTNYFYADRYNSQRNIGVSLKRIEGLQPKNETKKQGVLFISSGEYNVYDFSEIDSFAKLGYEIITLDISKEKQSQSQSSAIKIHERLGGSNSNYYLVDVNEQPTVLETLNQIFGVNKTPDTSIPGENPIKDVELRFDLGDKFEVVDGLESKGDTYIYPIGELKFKVEGGKYIYEPIEVEFTVKVKEVERTFTFNSAQLAYKYGSETFTIQDISKPIFSTVDSGGITIQVNDSSGNLDHSYNSANKLIDDQILNRFGQQYNLYGDSFANIKLEGDHLNHIEYQVIQSNQTPDFPQDNWTPYTVGKDGIINEDIDLEHQGFLTQKSYNVSHMPTLTGNAQWSNRDLVFQTPFDEVKYKPTTVATTKDEYVTRVEYIDENGGTQVRWETNSIFTENQTISREYKEATKSWGYFKAPKTGYYEFKTYTDDGMKATLTLEDESQFTIIDAFYPKGAGNGSVSSSRVYLEEGKFYPIYIEYFNWGGDAAFKYEYRVSQNANTQTPPNTKFESIPSDAFYPSKSKNPGEGSNNIFVGQSGIKIPNEIGRYYILYKAGTSDEDGSNFEETFRGIYGPFNVEDRFQLTRSVVDSEAIYKQGDIVSFKYIIQPRDILITDLYKTESALNGPIAEQLVVTNALFKDTLPAGLTIEKLISTDITNHVINVDVNGNVSISGPINHDIVYTLKRDPDNLANSKYEAKPITIFIEVQATDYGEFNFTSRAGALSYNDVTLEDNKLGATKDSFFGETLLEIEQSSEIIKHGLFTNGSGTDFIEEISPVTKVVKEMNYTFGVTMDIKASTSSFIIEIPRYIQNATVMLKDSTISLYELTDSGTVNKTTRQLIPSSNVLTKTDLTQIMSNVEESLISLEKGKKYLLTYDLSFTESIGLSAYTSTIDVLGKVDVTHKEIRLELLQNDNNLEDKLYLPDLL